MQGLPAPWIASLVPCDARRMQRWSADCPSGDPRVQSGTWTTHRGLEHAAAEELAAAADVRSTARAVTIVLPPGSPRQDHKARKVRSKL